MTQKFVKEYRKYKQIVNDEQANTNKNKTKLLEININNNTTFNINNVIIVKVDSIKYLGFIIDKELRFNDYMEFICKKIGEK